MHIYSRFTYKKEREGIIVRNTGWLFFFLHLTIEEENKYGVQKYFLLTPKQKKTVFLFDRCVQRLTSRRPLPQLSSCHSFINRERKKKRTGPEGEEKKRKTAFPKVVGEKKRNKQTKRFFFQVFSIGQKPKKERGKRRIKTPLALTCLTGWGWERRKWQEKTHRMRKNRGEEQKKKH